MAVSHATLRFLRTLHLYLGAFAAPALFFMALTGGLQVFNLHETVRGSSYVPPAWLVTAARLHKKQDLATPPPKKAAAAHAIPGQPAGTAEARLSPSPVAAGTPLRQWLTKIFFGLISLSLMASILTGVFMAYRGSRRPYLITTLLVAGLAVPVLILAA